ncbi:regulatory protein RecX [Actinoplanes sp. NPDC051494]|uniref:regulatory protein RecX n=1 Tax=Actinoplanes sp. NPDC051494 TaxID=3363907 RepID=UPI0037A3E5FE
MAGRRGARSGRGWDAIPPRATDENSPGDESRRGSGRRNSGRGSWGTGSGPDGSPAAGGPAAGGSAVGGPAAGGGRSAGNEPPRPESEVAREICLRQLAVRPRTRLELAKVLARKEISEEVIAEVLDRYDEVGIIDDAAFARAWVSTRHHGRGLARRALANELRQRGVDAEVATEALESVDEDAEATTARALVDRKLRTARGTPDQIFRRLVGMLARKGYPAGIAIRAVKDALAARDEEAAEFADQLDPDALDDLEDGALS